jgi:hypothetical protein
MPIFMAQAGSCNNLSASPQGGARSDSRRSQPQAA